MKIRVALFSASLALLTALPQLTAAAGAQPDAQMQAVLDKLASLGGKPIETLTPEDARKQPSPSDAVKALMKDQGKKPVPVGNTENIQIDLGDHRLDARVYTPPGEGPFPAILYIHGGGWVIADLDTYDASPRALCNGANATVISVEYRHSPEYKFPAAHEDCFAAYQWMISNPKKLKYDASRIAVVGESAGGNMAAAVCLMAKSKGIQLPVCQVLVYPVADATNLDSPSYQENADAKPLNKPMMERFYKQTLAKQEDAKNPNLSIVLSGNALSGLPPATVINAQIDPLRSEGEKYAQMLKAAGVKVDQKTYDGVTHEFFGMGSVVDKAKEAEDLAVADLKGAFGK